MGTRPTWWVPREFIFREILGETKGPRLDVFGACGSASLQRTTQLRHASRAPGLRFCGDPKGDVECPPWHAKRGVGIRAKLFLSGFASSWGH